MIRAIANYCTTLPAVWIDGSLYVTMSVVTFWLGILNSDQARAFIGPKAMFILTFVIGTANVALLSIKMFRSTAYADHQRDKQASGATPAVVPQPTTPPQKEWPK